MTSPRNSNFRIGFPGSDFPGRKIVVSSGCPKWIFLRISSKYHVPTGREISIVPLNLPRGYIVGRRGGWTHVIFIFVLQIHSNALKIAKIPILSKFYKDIPKIIPIILVLRHRIIKFSMISNFFSCILLKIFFSFGQVLYNSAVFYQIGRHMQFDVHQNQTFLEMWTLQSHKFMND